MQRVLITGGKGVLASYVKRVLKDAYQVKAPDKEELDITKKRKLADFFKKYHPNIVIHLAAKTNVDECEKKSKEAYLVNGEGTKNLAELCKTYKSKMLYLSTAAIFNGRKQKFYENDRPGPVNIYGKSKLRGEKYIKNILKDFIIIRSGWLIGGGVKQRKFVSIILDKAKTHKEIPIANDKFGTLTGAEELAEFINGCLKKNFVGVFHFGSKGICSRYDVAKTILKLSRSSAIIVPVPSSYFATSYPAPRPEREVLASRRIKFPFTWQTSLKRYFFKEIYNK